MTSDLLLLQQKINEKHCLTIKPTSPMLSNLSSLTLMNTPEQNLVEQALKRGNKIISSSNGTGEVTRSVKRLQNTPIRRWKERARERYQLTPPYRLLNKKRK
jgi:putative cell wall-binding protein